LVEDQAAVRALIKAVLKQRGYHVMEAGNGDEAMEVAGRYPGEIHLLVSDVVLPGMNGKELSERLQTIRTGVKVLFISGYTANVILRSGTPDRGVAFLRKPFSPEELAVKVRQVLSGRAGPEAGD
jgi:DNA-binding response OmpR family regulator